MSDHDGGFGLDEAALRREIARLQQEVDRLRAVRTPGAAADEIARLRTQVAQLTTQNERLAGTLRAAVVPPALGFDELAGLLAGAAAVIGIDTGLTHLAAALGAPTVGIYNATDPAATGIYRCARAVNIGGIGRAPTASQVIAAVTDLTP